MKSVQLVKCAVVCSLVGEIFGSSCLTPLKVQSATDLTPVLYQSLFASFTTSTYLVSYQTNYESDPRYVDFDVVISQKFDLKVNIGT